MINENEAMLDTDHLDELLETPAPSAPVVVVQYRNRGVPSWMFFPFVIVVTAVALYLYHRMVVERYRVQAAQDRSDLARQIEAERALQPLVRDSQPSTTVLPNPDKGTAVAGTGDAPGSSVNPAVATITPGTTEANPGDQGPTPPPGSIGQSGPLPGISGPKVTRNRSGPQLPLQPAGLAPRSIEPNPFTEDTNPPETPTPNDVTGSTAAVSNGAKTVPVLTGGPADTSPYLRPTTREKPRRLAAPATWLPRLGRRARFRLKVGGSVPNLWRHCPRRKRPSAKSRKKPPS
jgi:hypothetical protein